MFGRIALPALLICAIASPCLAEIGRVKRSVGTAWIERSARHLPPTVGQTLLEGDTLVTGPDGRISVTFIDNTRFSAGPKSRIALAQFKFNETTHRGAFVTRVDRGSLAVISGQIATADPKAMRIRTPTSLLGVRGTRFVVNVP